MNGKKMQQLKMYFSGSSGLNEVPQTLTVKLPASERFSAETLEWHNKPGTGLNDTACREVAHSRFKHCSI